MTPRLARLAFALTAMLTAAPDPAILLWQGTPPGEKGGIGAEHDTTTEKDRLVAGKRVARITNVTAPTLTMYHPPKKKRVDDQGPLPPDLGSKPIQLQRRRVWRACESCRCVYQHVLRS